MPDSKTIRIYDNEFEVPQPYSEGHTLSAIEAKVLNQCFAENIGNNQRAAIKKAIDEGTLDQARKDFATYAEGYQFTEAAAGGSRQTMTPEEKEAKKIATALVMGELKKQGKTKKEVDKDAFDAEVARVAQIDKVIAAAKKRVKDANQLADLLSGPEDEAA